MRLKFRLSHRFPLAVFQRSACDSFYSLVFMRFFFFSLFFFQFHFLRCFLPLAGFLFVSFQFCLDCAALLLVILPSYNAVCFKGGRWRASPARWFVLDCSATVARRTNCACLPLAASASLASFSPSALEGKTTKTQRLIEEMFHKTERLICCWEVYIF